MSSSLQLPPGRMTADEFAAWMEGEPEGGRYELIDGVIYGQAQERSAHALLKGLLYRRLSDAVERAGLRCTVYPDGMAVRVDAETVLGPDAMVRCGDPIPPDALAVVDPVVAVEIRSPSTASRDAGFKLEHYFRLPSLRHYLLIRTERAAMIHHCRDEAGTITTRIVGREPVSLDPPGLTVTEWWLPS